MRLPADLLRRGAAVLLFAVLAVAILIVASRESLASGSPKRRSDTALQIAVAQNLDAAALRQEARRLALADPMQAVSFFLQLMAMDLEKVPMGTKQRALIAEASKRQPSFVAPRIWLAADDVRKGRYAEALTGSDAVMRLNGEFVNLMVPILVPLLDEPKAKPLLEAKLQRFPIWRTAFLAELVKQGGRDRDVEAMLRHTPTADQTATLAAERSTWLQALVANGEAERAFALWQSFGNNAAKNGIADSRFDAANPVFPFAWKLATDDYSYAEKVTASGESGPIIRAHHSGDGRAVLLSQLVSLRAGAHILSFSMRDGGLAKPEKMQWRLRCLNSDAILAGQSLARLGSDWQRIDLSVDVPVSDCALQNLELVGDDNEDREAEVEIRSVEAQ